MMLRAARRLPFALAACALLWALAGCTKDEAARTQVMVVVDAEPGVRADAATLRIDVEGGATLGELAQSFSDTVGPGVPWPVRIALVPEGNDARRVFRIHAEARDGDGVTVVRTQVLSGYVEGRTKLLEVWLEDACRGVACGSGERCLGGACVDEAVDPTTLPDLPDVPADAGTDAGSDAGSDAGACSPPYTDCGTGGEILCVNLQTDPDHCGGCGVPCGALVCSSGGCALECDSGLQNCDGACVDLDTDRDHCSACNEPCAPTFVCIAGECTCREGEVRCDNRCITPNACGGCADLGASPGQPCGNCGRLECYGTDELVCQGEGVCAPGEVGAACSCGGGFTGRRLCEEDCQWGQCQNCICPNPCGSDAQCAGLFCAGGSAWCINECCVCVGGAQ
jgi:hypothetical protein